MTVRVEKACAATAGTAAGADWNVEAGNEKKKMKLFIKRLTVLLARY